MRSIGPGSGKGGDASSGGTGSAVPVIKIETTWVEPSEAVKVCVSVRLAPAPRAWTAAWVLL
ncbi:MAG: hypothetical protein WBM63_05235, partial [Sedimenticolaceae bacterium]